MFPICSSTPSCSSQSPIFSHSGIRALCPLGKTVTFGDRYVFGGHSQQLSFKTLYSNATQMPPDCLQVVPYQDNHHTLDDIQLDHVFTNLDNHVNDNACIVLPENKLLDISHQIGYSRNLSSQTANAAVDVTSNASTSLTDSLDGINASLENLVSAATSFVDASLGKGDLFFKNTITSPLKQTIQNVEEAISNAVNGLSSNADHSIELAGNRLTDVSVDLRDTTSKVGVVLVDLLRQTIVTLEYYLASGIKFIPYYYENAKELFPPDVRDVLNLTESKVTQILGPVASVFKQVYIIIEALERNLGLDPNDPIVPFVFFIGTSATLGTFYWALAYGGYSGDLSPQSTLEMLTGEKDVVLVDIRPEDLRERDGVPDLRRGARFKYASISLPEIDGAVRKLMKRERDLNDTLVAAVIRNLKIVKDRSRVIVLDADGTRSKSIARSLRKLGLKKPYLVQGGFQSWVKDGMRIKELKPETTFTVLNEEAEAILEDIRPTPLKVVGYGVGFIAASYALSEWEKTLQLVGVIGLGQTIYQRIASYEDSEDFKQDVRVLLSPFRVGTMAFSWAAGKLEPNRIGLPTSPSSSDVQSRVLQAAAKHESQPSDTDESSQEFPVAAANENTDSFA